MSLSPGVRLGPYEVLSLVGVGGMGEVYRARDTRLKRDVAVKVLPRNWADDGDRLRRFQREAELLAALNHPNIAAIYGIEEALGFKALILEMVEGPTLADRLAQGRVPLRDALAITRQLVDALDAAHERGIVHRDLKPANIKVRDDGTVKVLDFGLAKAFEPGNAQSDATTSPTMTSPAMTGVGVILGTAAYMSPEQARAQHVDKRSDIWAFGCVLYDMLVGQPAFRGATVADTIAGILSREPDWSAVPASMPASMVNLLRRCLDKDRKRRLRDIGDARHELDVAESDADRSPHAASTRLRWMAALTGAAIAASVLALSVVLWNRTRAAAPVSSIGPTFTRLTRDDRFSLEPALSRDGTLLIYASDRAGDGQLDLWLQRTAGGPPLRLTDDPADDREPDISPDGNFIAFRSNRGSGGIYVMPTLSGDARPVAEDGRRPRFSPDGTHIAYHTGPWLSGAGTRAAGFAVFTVAATGGQPTRLADRFTTARSPLWSADGRHVLLFGRPDGKDASAEFDWWWIPVDGGAPVATGAYRLLAARGLLEGTVNAGIFDALPAAWTPTGVLFSARLGDGVSLWRLAVSEDSGRAIETSLERLTDGAGRNLGATVDAAGRVAFQESSEGLVSLTLPLDSNAGRPMGAIVVHTFEGGQSGGRNSLDDAGRMLAYPKNRNEIWVKDLMSGQERHLVTVAPPSDVNAVVSQLNPVISHDGTKVAYTVIEGEQSIGYVVSATGGVTRKVCDQCNMHGWFADDRRILTLTPNSGAPGRVRALDVIDGTITDLAVHPAAIGRADISPDSRWLALGGPGRQVWITPVRPGNPPGEREWVSVLKANGAERACGWSPDGRLLYLLLERDGFRDLYAQRIDPARGTLVGEPFVVRHIHDPRRRWGSTPSGTAIVRNAFVFNQTEMTGSIWLLDDRITSANSSRR